MLLGDATQAQRTQTSQFDNMVCLTLLHYICTPSFPLYLMFMCMFVCVHVCLCSCVCQCVSVCKVCKYLI